MQASKHHVIIGDGVTAAAFAKYATLQPGDQLSIIGANTHSFGRGLAYEDLGEDKPWRDAYLLNSPAGAVEPNFVPWITQHWSDISESLQQYSSKWLAFGQNHLETEDFGALNFPRRLFGDFLQERASDVLAEWVEAGVQVELRNTLATGIERVGDQFQITLSGGENLKADSVDVATGAPSNQRYGADSGETAFTQLYGHEDRIAVAYLAAALCTVTCIGANAAMLDTLRLLQSITDEKNIRLQIISPSNTLPEPLIWQLPRTLAVAPALRGPFDSLQAFLHSLDTEMQSLRQQGARMAELRSGYYEYFNRVGLASLLPNREDQRLVCAALEHRFKRGPHNSLSDLHRLSKQGQVEFMQGKVESVYAREPSKNDITYRTPDDKKQHITVPLVVNTSGQGEQLGFDLITSDMIRHGWLQLDANKRGIKTNAKLHTALPGVRYCSPVVTEIGERVLPFPLFDYAGLHSVVANAKA